VIQVGQHFETVFVSMTGGDMKSLFCILAALVLSVWFFTSKPRNTSAGIIPPLTSADTSSAACTPPTQVTSPPDETAWRLFVAATCPVNNDKYPFVTWENWIEQNQLYTPSGSTMALEGGQRPRFHMSPLARLLQEQGKKKGRISPQLLPQATTEDCNTKTWSKRTICEETRLNPEAQKYITTEKLATLDGQKQFVMAGKTFQFTMPSVEIKADWIQLPSCANLPQGVHVETVNNVCYALGGLHLISKLVDKWIWATFEPQNPVTNPQRCLVLSCTDKWGSTPVNTSGSSTQLTQALSTLMNQANLAQEWTNYRLDGVQVDFLDSTGKPTKLGNSIIEGDNAGTPAIMNVSSCITCHDLSTLAAKGQQPTKPKFAIGGPASLPAGYVRRDFVWSLSLAQ
jgi:hypothetical protein